MVATSATVTFKVDDLIQAARTILIAKERAVEQYRTIEAQYLANNKAQWFESREDNIRKLRDYLTKSLRNKTVPRTADINHFLGGTPRTYNGADSRWLYETPGMYDLQKPPGYNANTDGLGALVAMLEAHQGQTVSATQLRNLGFKGSAVLTLFRDVWAAEQATRKAAEKAAV